MHLGSGPFCDHVILLPTPRDVTSPLHAEEAAVPGPLSCSGKAQAHCRSGHTAFRLRDGVNRPPAKARPVRFVWGKKEKATCKPRGQVRTCSTGCGRNAAE